MVEQGPHFDMLNGLFPILQIQAFWQFPRKRGLPDTNPEVSTNRQHLGMHCGNQPEP